MRALIFDLDGTLVDTVYAHVFAWQRAFSEVGLSADGWRIHRRVGMGGSLLTLALAREVGHPLTLEQADSLKNRYGEIFRELLPKRRPIPGAIELLCRLREAGVPHGIATSGHPSDIEKSLDALGVCGDTVVVDGKDVQRAKPNPELFMACQARLGVAAEECYVAGDAVWDLLAARRARMLGLAVLTGGYSEGELVGAGAYRVFRSVAEIGGALEELGLLPTASV